MGDPHVRNALLKSKFFEDNSDIIIDRGPDVDFALSEAAVANPRLRKKTFVPMPFQEPGHFFLCFLRLRDLSLEKKLVDIDFIALSKQPNMDPVGYRFEVGRHGATDLHGYLHVQLTESFDREEQGDGAILLTPLPHMSVKFPAFPLSNECDYSAVFCCLLSFAGLTPNLKKGLVQQFELCVDYYDGNNFSAAKNKIADICKTIARY